MKTKKEIGILVLILVTAAFLRFYNLMHDSPYFFNPDERNMANAISQFKLPATLPEIPICLIGQVSPIVTHNPQPTTHDCNLNPHFFAYGQFPLYLAFASDQISKVPISLIGQISQIPPTTNNPPARNASSTAAGGQLTTNFPSAIFWLRFWSALSSTFTVLLVYLIAKEIFSYSFLRSLKWEMRGVKLDSEVRNVNQHDQIILLRNLTSYFSLLTSLFAAFSPGLIQSAHFGTTESLLTFFFLSSVYLSLRYLSGLRSLKFILLTSLVIGLALGSKLTGLFFYISPSVSLMVQIIKLFAGKISKKKKIIGLLGYWVIGLFIFVGSILIFILSSPYNLVEPENFKSAVFGYEQDVAMGRYEAFYTRQFVNTTPILFQAEKIFPYTLGWPVFIFGTLGFLLINFQILLRFFFFVTRKYKILKIKYKKYNEKSQKDLSSFKIFYLSFLIFNFSFLIYLIPNAFLFTKWTRFMTPILPFFSIFSAYFLYWLYSFLIKAINKNKILNIKYKIYISNIKKSKIFNILYAVFIFYFLFLILLPGAAFMSIYTHEDSRVTASRWIYQNIPNNSYIISETANVVDIPVSVKITEESGITKNYTVISFDFYRLDENPLLFTQLIQHLEKANYIFIPSRRIFANYTKLPQIYPLVTKYYQLLFSGALGFEKVTKISSFPRLGFGAWNLEFDDEPSEETFTVFDHPVIRIFRKVNPLTIEQYRLLFRN